MQFTVVTGMSGSGKSLAMNVLEDIGFYCIDNMPPQLLHKFVDLCIQSGGKLERVAIAMDIRSGDSFEEMRAQLEQMKGDEKLDVKVKERPVVEPRSREFQEGGQGHQKALKRPVG